MKRQLTFVAWADAVKKQPFDLKKAVTKLSTVKTKDVVLEHGPSQELMSAVDHVRVGTTTRASQFQLLALHDEANAPSEWGPGAGARPVTIGKDSYTAFFTHVLMWPDKIAAFDGHANAPGLGRLAEYIRRRTGERVVFRALYEQGLQEQLKDIEAFRTFEWGVHNPHKKSALSNSGMFGSLPPMWEAVPSVQVKMGMSRRGRRDAYLPDDIADEVIDMSDAADEYFDRLVIVGPSKTRKQPNGRPVQVRVDLLNQRLRRESQIKRSSDGGNLPDRDATFKALRALRTELDKDGKLKDAHEARIAFDQAA